MYEHLQQQSVFETLEARLELVGTFSSATPPPCASIPTLGIPPCTRVAKMPCRLTLLLAEPDYLACELQTNRVVACKHGSDAMDVRIDTVSERVRADVWPALGLNIAWMHAQFDH